MSRDEFIAMIQQEYNIHSAYMVVLTAVIEQVANFPVTKYPSDAPRNHSDNDDDDANAEYQFEKILQFGRMTGFTVPIIEATSSNTGDPQYPPRICPDVLQVLLDRIRTLGNTKLLGRGRQSTTTATSSTGTTRNKVRTDDIVDNDDDDLDEDDDDVDGPTRRTRVSQEAQKDTVNIDVAASTANASSSSSSSSSTLPSTFTKCAIPTPSFQSDRRMVRLILARYWADLLIQRYHTGTKNRMIIS
jgi:hypothetical protein